MFFRLCAPKAYTSNHLAQARTMGSLARQLWAGVTITDPESLGKQGQVLHPEQNRLLYVREFAISQGFNDNFMFAGLAQYKHRDKGFKSWSGVKSSLVQ